MYGNVWEWCADDWHNSYKERQKPSGDRIFLFCQIGFKLFGRALTRLNIDVAKNVERFFATSILATFP